MAIVRFSPWNELARMQDDMSRMWQSLAPRGEEELSSGWTPQVDVYEDENGIHLHADIPGVDAQDIQVNVDNGVLSVKGERKLAREDKKENYHRVERFYGHFSRSFMLPDYADAERIEANAKNGVLELFVPKKAEKKPKSIKVEVK